MSSRRNVIVHYHLFKNAGSSIDHLLKFNFGDKWMAYDSDSASGIISTKGLEKLIADNPEVDAFSSCLLYTSPSPRDATLSRMPSSA